MRVDAEQIGAFVGREHRSVARWAIDAWGHAEQAGRPQPSLQLDQGAPGLEQLRELADTLLPHLVAAGAAQHQRNDVALFGAETGNLIAQFVLHEGAVYALGDGYCVQLMQLQPQAIRRRAVELCGAH